MTGEEIDPSWGAETSEPQPVPPLQSVEPKQTVTPVQKTKAPPGIPTPPKTTPLPPSKTRRPALFVGLIVSVGLILIASAIYFLSEAGIISWGVESLWGLSNQPSQAIPVAAKSLEDSSSYEVNSRFEIKLTPPGSSSNSTLRGELTQDHSSVGNHFIGRFTYAPASGDENRFGPLFSTGQTVPVELIATTTDLYLRLPETSDQWAKTPLSEISLQGVKYTDWPEIFGFLANADGGRIGGQTINGVKTKGYRLQTPASSFVSLFFQKLQASTDIISSNLYIGSDQKPYSSSFTGTFSIGQTKAELAADFEYGSFGSTPAVTVPTLVEVTEMSLAQWLADVGLGTSESEAGRDAVRKADLRRISVALAELAANSTPFGYPRTEGIVMLEKSEELKNALRPYLDPLPSDPNRQDRFYGYSSDGESFRLSAVLETPTDPEGVQVGNYLLYVVESQ